MRTSSEGTQASREGKLYPQDANVAEVDMVRLLMSNPRTPIIINPPTIANEVGRRTGFGRIFTPCPATRMIDYESSATGRRKSLQHPSLVSSAVRCVKGSKGHLSQRINCYASNAGTECNSRRKGRLVDSQCHTQGRRVVVVSERVMPLTGRRTLAEKVHSLQVAGRQDAALSMAYTIDIQRDR